MLVVVVVVVDVDATAVDVDDLELLLFVDEGVFDVIATDAGGGKFLSLLSSNCVFSLVDIFD